MTGISEIVELNEISSSGLPIHGKISIVKNATKIICFMPSAISRGVNRNPLQLSRFRWAEDLTEFHVLALADPAITMHVDLLGGWYVHREDDLLTELGFLVSKQIKNLGLKNSDVLFYGSSLGGYGALALSSIVEGSSAIAEVPQIDVSEWSIRSAVTAIENHILGESFDTFRLEQPHKVDLIDRFIRTGNIPNFKIITNVNDAMYRYQKNFMEELLLLNLPVYGNQQLHITTEVSGHKAISKNLAISAIREWAKGIPFTVNSQI